ncbi:hypothetical protein BDB01DRAFT_849647 [Pilobolus umbonatus]|nr:hypothetical protein BDB01DRAFT_849647 [Pilobolus umbonatus]
MNTRKVAFAIDPLSEEAPKTVKWAMENFLRKGDVVYAVMVIVLDVELEDLDSLELPTSDSLEVYKKEIIEEKTKAMKKYVDIIQKAGYQVESKIFKTVVGNACDVLIQYVEEGSMDCLVLGSRNLSGWKRFFLGSFSDYVQAHVHCPVLIIK